ncbi:MAG: adenine phosphoribosyltransferase [Anaerohalosphaera sp.]|nr:adenine phosphoribosyltransferase [Anaerohalosphaera sp.]
MDLREYIRDIPDYPIEGILFRDITPLLGDRAALAAAIDALSKPYVDMGIDYVAAVEARGFIFGSAVAKAINAGFIPMRKPGKLPHKSESLSYDLEYGSNTIEVHVDAIKPGSKVLMVDDLLATGGTMDAACKLIERLGGKIAGLTFLIELTGLNGRDLLPNYPIHTVISY